MLDILVESSSFRKVVGNLLNRMGIWVQYISKTNLSEWVAKERIATIIDVGAFDGDWMMKWRKIVPNARIFCFEPIPDAFKELQKKACSLSNLKIFNIALGDFNGNIEMHHNFYGPSSSILEITDTHIMNYPFTSRTKKEEVKIMRLDDALENEVLRMNILIKVDVQGYEDKVIKGGFNTFSKAKIIIIETSFFKLYEGQPLFREIYSEMERMGFTYAGSLGDYHSKIDGSVLQQDSVFVRK